MPWLVSLSAGRWQMKGIQKALSLGIRVLALDGDPDAVGLSISTRSVVVDITDVQAVLAAISSTGIIPSGVISLVSEVGMPAAAAVRDQYSLPGPDVNLTKLLTNKVEQRTVWKKHKIPGPDWAAFSSAEEALEASKKLGFPCVVKPADSAGSRGVTKVECLEELLESAENALNGSRIGLAIIETFMVGVEYAIETFSAKGSIHVLAVSEKKKVPGTKGTIASELATPADEVKSKIVADAAVSALRALEYLDGPGHTEVILDKYNRPGLVETAGRGGGFMVFERMVEKVSGFDIVTASILQSLDLLNTFVLDKTKRFVVLRFIASKKGTVSMITGLEKAQLIPGVEADVLVKLGQNVNNVNGDGDRLAYILSEASTREKAMIAADKAETLINIKVD